MKIYADRRFLPPDFHHCEMLYPFWGDVEGQGDRLLEPSRFKRYLAAGPQIFELAPLDKAEAAILPFNWKQFVDYPKNFPEKTPEEIEQAQQLALRLAEELASSASKMGTPLVVFYTTDDHTSTVPLENSLVFRDALVRSEMRPNEFALSSFRVDFLETYIDGMLQLRDKGSIPVVAYCGYDNLHKKWRRDRVKHALGRRPMIHRLLSATGVDVFRDAGSRIRSQAVYVLERSEAVSTNFIIRDAFWNGAITRHNINVELAHRSRNEYVANMLDGDYVLCARGMGNNSFRFYETVSIGRIPVFIDSEMVLPFEDIVDYQQYAVWVGESELPRIADIVAEFHAGISAKQFRDLQQECRQLWLDWLSPEGFFKNFYRHFT